MKKLNYNKLLDLTLGVLLNETSNSYIEYNRLFSKDSILTDLSNRDKFALIEKLVKDEYAAKFKETQIPNYYITVEGITFFNNGKGGYMHRAKKEKTNTVWNYTKNAFLIIGTTAATILAILQIKHELSPEFECKASQSSISTPYIEASKEPLKPNGVLRLK